MVIKIENINFSYSDVPILKDISLEIPESRFSAILGPNGVGKSTLLLCMNNLLKPTQGNVYIEGKDVGEYTLKELSKIAAYVPASTTSAFPISVMDAILIGRTMHSTWKSREDDLKIAYNSLKVLGIEELALRTLGELSSGQHQKVMLARGIAQNTKILLLDEPTSNLDVRHQLEVTQMLKALTEKKNKTVVMICHDINIAAKFADEIILMSKGTVHSVGTPAEIITEESLSEVYGVKTRLIDDNGRPHVILDESFYELPELDL